MFDELANFELYAFGVGQGVDNDELNRIVCAGAGIYGDPGDEDSPEQKPELPEELVRYMPLRVMDDPDDW